MSDGNAALRESARKMTEKWELDGIDCDEIEANSNLTLDGGFDFNSIWNSCSCSMMQTTYQDICHIRNCMIT